MLIKFVWYVSSTNTYFLSSIASYTLCIHTSEQSIVKTEKLLTIRNFVTINIDQLVTPIHINLKRKELKCLLCSLLSLRKN